MDIMNFRKSPATINGRLVGQFPVRKAVPIFDSLPLDSVSPEFVFPIQRCDATNLRSRLCSPDGDLAVNLTTLLQGVLLPIHK